jgi:carboxymethylenebutenolidase
MSSRTEQIDAGAGAHFSAYVSVPERPNGHAIIVLQEIFGVTKAIRAVADRFAAEGYLAVAPDLFWRLEPGVELSHSKEDIGRAFGFLKRFSDDLGVEDIGTVAAHVRARPGFKGRVFVAGLCLGGKLAYLAAARLDVDAAVSFYGVGIEENLSEASKLRCPLLMHFGEIDQYAPPAAVAQIAAAVKADPRVAVHSYAGADHGFYTRGDEATIRSAHERTLVFLRSVESRQ